MAPGNCSLGATLGGALRPGRRGQRRAPGMGCGAEAGMGSWSPDSRAGRGCPGASRSFPPLLWTLTGGQRAGGGGGGGGQAARGGGSRPCGALIGWARVESGDGKRSAALPSFLLRAPPPLSPVANVLRGGGCLRSRGLAVAGRSWEEAAAAGAAAAAAAAAAGRRW